MTEGAADPVSVKAAKEDDRGEAEEVKDGVAKEVTGGAADEVNSGVRGGQGGERRGV